VSTNTKPARMIFSPPEKLQSYWKVRMSADGSIKQDIPDANGNAVSVRVQLDQASGHYRPLNAADVAFVAAAIERQYRQDVADYKATMSHVRSRPTGTTKATAIPAKPISSTPAKKPAAPKAAKPVNEALDRFVRAFGLEAGSVHYVNGVSFETVALQKIEQQKKEIAAQRKQIESQKSETARLSARLESQKRTKALHQQIDAKMKAQAETSFAASAAARFNARKKS